MLDTNIIHKVLGVENQTFVRALPPNASLLLQTNRTMSTLHLQEAVDDAATKALHLIRTFAETNPHNHDGNDAPDNPWRHPQQIFRDLDAARQDLTAASTALRRAAARIENGPAEPRDVEDFRAAYVDMVTDAFANVLEELHAEEEAKVDVDILVDCLQSGMGLMTQDEKDLFLQEDEGEDDDDLRLTPHEIRRRQLGFKVETPASTSEQAKKRSAL